MAKPTICQRRGRHSQYGWIRERSDEFECADCHEVMSIYPVAPRIIEPPKDWYTALCERVAA